MNSQHSEQQLPNYAVLFVDDEEGARENFSEGMHELLPVYTAASVEEAKAVIAEHGDEIAIVVSDQKMPGGNGTELLDALRRQRPDTIRFLTTAYTEIDDAIHAVNKGEIHRYIRKPWNMDELHKELSDALALFNFRRERDELLREKLSLIEGEGNPHEHQH